MSDRTGISESTKVVRQLSIGYVVLSLLTASWMAALIVRDGPAGFYLLQGEADPSAVAWRFVNFVTAWVAVGASLVMARKPEFVKQHLPVLLVLLLVFFEYLIPLREPHPVREGDFSAYFDAAVAMRSGVAINQDVPRLYLYPPLLASLLQPLTVFGLMPVLGLFKLGSQVMLGLVVVLLHRVSGSARYTPVAAAVALGVVFMANAPLHHNFVFSQVNVYVLTAMLLSVWLYPRSWVWSAVALAVGTHLKVYPVLLVLPFLVLRDWRWLIAFSGAMLAIVAATSLINSPMYYLEFFGAIRGLTETGLRTSAVDSLVYNSFRLAGVPNPVLERWIANLCRLVIGVWGVWISVRFMLAGVAGEADRASVVRRGFAVLPLVMLLVSPSQWPHHFVLVIPSMLLLLPFVRPGRDLTLFGAAYAMIFLFPVNEVFPFPYLRLASLCAMLWIVQATMSTEVRVQPWFTSLQAMLPSGSPAPHS